MKFSPMPYVELAPGYSNLSSHFVMAWQLLNLISLNESLTDVIYGSCLVYKGSVVCTQLDVASTRWIANIVEAVTTDDSAEFTEATENFFKVFVNISSITSLTNKSKINIKSTTSPEKIEVLTEQPQSTMTDSEENEVPGKIRAGVYIVHLEDKISICMLMNWKACFENSYFKKIFHIISSNSGLTKKLSKLLSKIVIAPPEKNVTENPKDTILIKPYNFFSLDELTSMQNGIRGIQDLDVDNNFSMTINWAHDLFSERPDASKLILRNHTGSIFCRKKFGKETFFQCQVEKFEEFEEIARQNLKNNHNINFV